MNPGFNRLMNKKIINTQKLFYTWTYVYLELCMTYTIPVSQSEGRAFLHV